MSGMYSAFCMFPGSGAAALLVFVKWATGPGGGKPDFVSLILCYFITNLKGCSFSPFFTFYKYLFRNDSWTVEHGHCSKPQLSNIYKIILL